MAEATTETIATTRESEWFFGNVHFDTSSQEFEDFARELCRPFAVEVPRYRTRLNRDYDDQGKIRRVYGFVAVILPEAADELGILRAVNGSEFKGRTLAIQKARPRSPLRKVGG